jgi:hypothetical protein
VDRGVRSGDALIRIVQTRRPGRQERARACLLHSNTPAKTVAANVAAQSKIAAPDDNILNPAVALFTE